MALQRAAGVKTNAITNPMTASAIHVATFTHVFTKAAAAPDIIEIGALPAGCKLAGATAFTDAAPATYDVGFMSGVYGEQDDGRTVGAELFDGVARDAVQTLDAIAATAIDPTDDARGIGVSLAGAQTAGATYVTVVIEYYQP